VKANRSTQHGASILELMTGLVIGMMVTVAALGSLAFVQLSASVKEESFRLQQRAAVALQVIGAQLRQAGAIELTQAADASAVAFSNAFDGYDGSGYAMSGKEGNGKTGDALRVSRQDNGVARDCLGNRPEAAQAGIRVDSRFYLASGELRCLGANTKSGSQAIVDKVEDFQVVYGMRVTNAAGPMFRWIDAAAVGQRWTEVQAVRVCLQLLGERRSSTSAPQAEPGCRGLNPPDDKQLRRVVRATFTLRNAAI
jgi:type IV pilus assembly protein PilW